MHTPLALVKFRYRCHIQEFLAVTVIGQPHHRLHNALFLRFSTITTHNGLLSLIALAQLADASGKVMGTIRVCIQEVAQAISVYIALVRGTAQHENVVLPMCGFGVPQVASQRPFNGQAGHSCSTSSILAP